MWGAAVSFRLSPHAAALKAIELAEALLRAQPASDWRWQCGEAVPDVSAVGGGRKVSTKWIVAVWWFQGETAFDGPSTIAVDLDSETADFCDHQAPPLK